MSLEDIPEEPANDPYVVKFWRDRTAAAASVPSTATGTVPSGSRPYVWPYGELHVDAANPPTFSWSRDGVPVPLQPSGVTEFPQFWWLVQEYGKQPWNPNADELMPPPIGSDRFAFDGEDGAQYINLDLVPHAP